MRLRGSHAIEFGERRRDVVLLFRGLHGPYASFCFWAKAETGKQSNKIAARQSCGGRESVIVHGGVIA
jgi:hypothetical protein